MDFTRLLYKISPRFCWKKYPRSPVFFSQQNLGWNFVGGGYLKGGVAWLAMHEEYEQKIGLIFHSFLLHGVAFKPSTSGKFDLTMELFIKLWQLGSWCKASQYDTKMAQDLKRNLVPRKFLGEHFLAAFVQGFRFSKTMWWILFKMLVMANRTLHCYHSVGRICFQTPTTL